MTGGGRSVKRELKRRCSLVESQPPSVSLSRLVKCMQVTHKGRRYWAFGPVTFVVAGQRRWRWSFWSDHCFPWYSGGLTLLADHRIEAARAFVRWLPFEVEVVE